MTTLNNAIVDRARQAGLKIIARPYQGSKELNVQTKSDQCKWVISGKSSVSDLMSDLQNLKKFLEVA